jgi:hypothetical protein
MSEAHYAVMARTALERVGKFTSISESLWNGRQGLREAWRDFGGATGKLGPRLPDVRY